MIDQYIAAGWSLTPIPPQSKGPIHKRWNMRGAALASAADLPDRDGVPYGVGLMHAYSGTMALDIDDWDAARVYLAAENINLDALYADPNAVQIISGKPGHGKLLYRMPFGLTLPTKKFHVAGNRKVAFELRCGTEGKSDQDILPPSIHPDTKQPYRWGGAGHWSRLPPIPGQLLDIWTKALADTKPVKVDGIDSSWEEIQDALSYISSDCGREDWINVGMALHWAGEQTSSIDQAFHIWDEWSKPSTKYPGERAIAHQWASFRTSKGSVVTLGTLFHLARAAGWVRPTPDAAGLFGSVAPTPPTDIMRMLRPAPPPVELDLFPALLARRAREVAEGVGCDPLVPLWAGLGAVSACIDSRSRLELVEGFKVPPVLWLMTVGEPADKKTPGSRPMLEPLYTLEAEDRPRYAREMTEWELLNSAWSAAKKNQLEYAGSSAYALDPSQLPQVWDEPKKPTSVKFTVSDVTSQKLVHIAKDRPRGLLCYLDEMSSWVGKVTNKFSGEDRSCWVVSYESMRYEMDRVGAGPVHAENLAVGIFGNIQPRVLGEHFDSLTADGLMQRFLPAVLRPEETRLGHPVPEFLTSAHQWERMLRNVFATPVMEYRLSSEARGVYREFQQWYEDRKVTERLARASNTYMTAFGKLEGLVGRLALVFHASEASLTNEVPADVVRRVIRIVKEYVIPVYRHLYDTDDSSSTAFDVWVAEHIIHHADLSSIASTDIRRSARRQFEKSGVKHATEQYEWITNAMEVLEKRGWVARADNKATEWLINPRLKDTFADYRKAVVKAKVERMQETATWGNGKRVTDSQEMLEQ